MDPSQLKKKYDLPTAIAMVIGVVAGSGVFFKAESVLTATGGDVRTGIAAWALVGLVMVVCSNAFSILASRYERAGGLVDFAALEVGSTFSFFLGWFMATIYFPSLNAILAWLTARYLCVFFGVSDLLGGTAMLITAFVLILLFTLNSLAPRFSGRFQVVATVIKLLPLAGMAIFGIFSGINSGMLAHNFSNAAPSLGSGGLLAAMIAVAFTYEGWIVAVSINGELKNARRNMPVALTVGSLIIVVIYMFYYIGLTGAVTTETLMQSGPNGTYYAFESIFGTGVGSLVIALLVVSCLSTCNALSAANCRSLYALAVRSHLPSRFAGLDSGSNMPLTSSIASLLLTMLWLLHFYGSNIPEPWFPETFCFDSSELPIITLYAFYIPIFLLMMKREKELGVFSRFILPALAVCCSLFMVVACVLVHRTKMPGYLTVFAADMLAGYILLKYRKKIQEARAAKNS